MDSALEHINFVNGEEEDDLDSTPEEIMLVNGEEEDNSLFGFGTLPFLPSLTISTAIKPNSSSLHFRETRRAVDHTLEPINFVNGEEENEEFKVRGQYSHDNDDKKICLDSSIWRNLPSDILERVLTHLPVLSLLRFKTVCKRFNRVILSKPILNTHSHLPSRDPWIAVFQSDSCSHFHAYNPSLNAWHQISLSFLPFHVRGLASAGGLLCCRGEQNGSLSIVVCNPITKRWMILPPMIKKRLVPIVSTVVERSEFKVFVAGDDLLPDGNGVKDLSSEVYESSTSRWTLSGPIPPETDLELCSVICNGNLYFITCSPYGALSFNLQEGVWTKIQAPMPKNLTIPSLVECSGRIFMVGGALKKTMLDSIRIWELCENAMAWKEVAKMKNKLFKELYSEERELYFSAVGHGNLIYFSIYNSPQMLAYDIFTRLWFWLPPHPATGASEGKHLFCYPFKPNLYSAID